MEVAEDNGEEIMALKPFYTRHFHLETFLKLLQDNLILPDSGYPNAVLLDGTRAMTGDLDVDDNALKFTDVDCQFYPIAANTIRLCKIGVVGTYRDFQCNIFTSYLGMRVIGDGYMRAGNLNTNYIYFQTYSGAAWTECARLTGGAGTPEFNISRAGDITMLAGKALYNADHIELDEITTPTAVADHGKVYTKNDNKLYFQDGAGAEHEIAFV